MTRYQPRWKTEIRTKLQIIHRRQRNHLQTTHLCNPRRRQLRRTRNRSYKGNLTNRSSWMRKNIMDESFEVVCLSRIRLPRYFHTTYHIRVLCRRLPGNP